jgi:anhydro-N-acetylmuramic acid kinase
MTVPMDAIGVISGTSMDGIDVSVVTTDGHDYVVPGPGATYPYTSDLRAALLDFIRDPTRAETDPLDELEARVTAAHVAAVEQFMGDQRLDRARIALVGLHGQTVWHNPAQRFTRQLMRGDVAAERLGLDTVTRFRHADVAAGGQGAPFAPLYHRALAARLAQPVMVLNWGGVGNVTYIEGDTVIAFDTGPASALLDDWVLRRCGVPFDDGGRIAAAGRVNAAVLQSLMQNPYFALPAPKSLDRQEFHARAKIVEPLSAEDGAATLAAFTVAATAAALEQVPKRPVRWLVTGGGRLNHHLMSALQTALGVAVEPVETVGWQGDHIEAQCFGYLAVRALHGLALSLPTTTGVPVALTGGEVVRAPRRVPS